MISPQDLVYLARHPLEKDFDGFRVVISSQPLKKLFLCCLSLDVSAPCPKSFPASIHNSVFCRRGVPPKRSLQDGASVVTLEELTAGARKTERGKVSATDVIMVVKKCERRVAAITLKRLQDEERIPKLEMVIFGVNILFTPNPGRGGNRLPEAAADAREMVQILWALPGDSTFRRNSADVVVRYLGGDPQLVSEVTANRAAPGKVAKKVLETPPFPQRLCEASSLSL